MTAVIVLGRAEGSKGMLQKRPDLAEMREHVVCEDRDPVDLTLLLHVCREVEVRVQFEDASVDFVRILYALE